VPVIDPGVAVALVALCAVYALGARRRPATVTPARLASLVGAVVVLVVALASPLDARADDRFSMHMTQHLLVGLVAPLLLVLAAPVRVAAGAIDSRAMRWLTRWSRALELRRDRVAVGLAAVALHAATFWVWHVPALYDAAVRHAPVHALEHASLLGGGIALWAVVVPAYRRSRTGVAVVWLFLSGLQAGAMAALLTLAPRPLYVVHGTGAAALDDQRLAGAVMWLPGGLVYAVAAIVLLLRWLDAAPRRAPVLVR
jgi:cytochrome c oxidase assembly factor CtaG